MLLAILIKNSYEKGSVHRKGRNPERSSSWSSSANLTAHYARVHSENGTSTAHSRAEGSGLCAHRYYKSARAVARISIPARTGPHARFAAANVSLGRDYGLPARRGRSLSVPKTEAGTADRGGLQMAPEPGPFVCDQ